MIEQKKIDSSALINEQYREKICSVLGDINDWVVKLMQACLDLYAVQSGVKTISQTSLGYLSSKGQWVLAMMAERDRCLSAIQNATTETDIDLVTPQWPANPV